MRSRYRPAKLQPEHELIEFTFREMGITIVLYTGEEETCYGIVMAGLTDTVRITPYRASHLSEDRLMLDAFSPSLFQ